MVIKNKRGDASIFVILMLCVTFMILGMAFAKPLVEVAASNMLQLNCSAPADNYFKGVCYSLDIFSSLFTLVIFGLVGYLLTGIGIR